MPPGWIVRCLSLSGGSVGLTGKRLDALFKMFTRLFLFHLSHFILHCPALSDIRNKMISLQKPYMEDEVQIMTLFLFEESTASDKKEDLYKLWRARERNRKALT